MTDAANNKIPPTNLSGEIENSTRVFLTKLFSILFIAAGFWALFVMLRSWLGNKLNLEKLSIPLSRLSPFGKIRLPKNLMRAFELAAKPSAAFASLGILFVALFVSSFLIAPTTTVSARKQLVKNGKKDVSHPRKPLAAGIEHKSKKGTLEKMIGVDNPANESTFKSAVQIGGSGVTQLGQAVYDADGNLYVTGGFTGSITLGSTTLTATKDFDMFIAKFDANIDAWVWARKGSGAANGVPNNLALEAGTTLAVAGGNVYVAGSFVKTLTLQGGANPNLTLNDNGSAGINYEPFVAKYDAANGDLQWEKGGASGSSIFNGRKP